MKAEMGEGWYPAPAKLNLFLHVVGRRADGYHLLQTVFRFLDVGDRLEISSRTDGRIVLHAPLAGLPPEQDLCWRAAQALRQQAGCRLGADIRLDKRLPMGGGLGGGSSDAATVLLVLNRLWGLGLSRTALQHLGLGLGADVPVFIFGQSAFAEGVGEVLTPWAPDPASYVVLAPEVHVSTPAIFAHPALTRNTPSVTISALSEGMRNHDLRNDLEPVACALYPEVAESLAWLKTRGDARMTGSGACVFAAFPDRPTAEKVFADRPGHLKGFVADGVDRHPLHEWAE
ncbi:MAG: 4-(cytidine 5'-diphospho)-2-C-methyl-D-erythritol kinase [Thiobacillus sp.]|nr:4-(cytidine 5'-diphospho)-2-C-methyl-D-erythritol kinase [Thiobacillus sp.]